MPASPFQLALEALLRPLEFAARDDFAALERVRNLAGSVTGATREVATLAVPADVRKTLEREAQRFEKPLEGDALREAVGRALAALRPLAEPAWTEAALARRPDVLPGVGPRTAEALAKRELRSVGDLLFHLPMRLLRRINAEQDFLNGDYDIHWLENFVNGNDAEDDRKSLP